MHGRGGLWKEAGRVQQAGRSTEILHAVVEGVHVVGHISHGVHAVDATHSAHGVHAHVQVVHVCVHAGHAIHGEVVRIIDKRIRWNVQAVVAIRVAIVGIISCSIIIVVVVTAVVAIAVVVGGVGICVVLSVELRYQRSDLVEVHAVG